MKVSVCIATYNGSKYLRPQIKSILQQIGENDELIISDDKSTDDTVHIINSFKDKRIKIYINHKKNGVAKNFENALKKATGDYIFLSDQDDIWAENKIDILTQELAKTDCVLHNAQLIDAEGKLLGSDLFSIYKTRKGFIKNFTRNTYVGCCMAFRKEMLQYILPIPNVIKMHDMWIALIAEKKGSTKLIDSELILYRRHDNNASSTSGKSNFSRFYQIKYRLQMLFYIVLR